MPRTKLDKIFDNKFHETEYVDNSNIIDFHSDHFIEEIENPYRKIVVENITNEIDLLIDTHFSEFKIVVDSKVKRINKEDINLIYNILREKLIKKYAIVDIWYYLAEYFDVDTNRFFDSLDDKFKNELIMYLKVNTNLLKDDSINNLY
jgi:hypothetical protein